MKSLREKLKRLRNPPNPKGCKVTLRVTGASMRMRVKNTGELIEVYPYPVKGKMQFKHATADRYFTWEELTPDSVRSSAQQGSVSDICMQVTPTISGSVTTITKD